MGSEPLFGALIAGFWLGERLTLTEWSGGLLILVATMGTLCFGRAVAPDASRVPPARPEATAH